MIAVGPARIFGTFLLLGCLTHCIDLVQADASNARREAFKVIDNALYRGESVDFGQLKNYPLYPYLVYRDLNRRLDRYPTAEVRDFLADYGGAPPAERLRKAWLEQLAQGNRWADYLRDYRRNENIALDCWRRQALLQTGNSDDAVRDIERIWLTGTSLPQACDPLFALWRQRGGMTREQIWRRFALAMEKGRGSLARYLQDLLPAQDQATAGLWLQVDRNPRLILESGSFNANNPRTPAILLHGVRRWSGADSVGAASALDELRKRYALPPDELAALDRQLALFVASRGDPSAMARLTALPSEQVDTQVREWRVRFNLKQRNWGEVLNWIDRLAPEERRNPRWRYWRARALEAQGNNAEAQALYRQLAGLRNYHGFLAANRLGAPYRMQSLPLAVSPQTHDALLARSRGLQRARELYVLGRHWEARVEWKVATQGFGEEDLKTAAKLAQSWDWHYQAIRTLVRAGYYEDLELRFPTPYRDSVRTHGASENIDPAWIYAVMRQESLFQTDAKSHAGAMGLMQIMPATGQRIARELGTRLSGKYALLKVDTNIRFGAHYLRHTLDKLQDNPLLATAAYNAGPNRVAQWLPKTQAMAPDLWAETIPYKETRKYAQRVMEYATIYAWRLGNAGGSINGRMRTIMPDDSGG